MRVLSSNRLKTHDDLDKIDTQILTILSNNSRTSFKKISSQVNLSKDAVRYRIKRLEKRNILQGSKAIIDVSKLGYDNFHLFIQLNKPISETDIVEKLSKLSFIRAILSFTGKFDLELSIIVKSIASFDEKMEQLQNIVAPFIKNQLILIPTRNYTSKVLPFITPETSQPKQEPKTDEIDLAIIEILAQNANTPYYEIANKIKLSPDAVTYRIKNLQQSGIINKFVPIINYAALNYSIYALLININSLDSKTSNTLKETLNQDSSVLWAVKCIGSYNLLLYLCVKDTEQVHDTINNLRITFGAKFSDYELLIGSEEYKYAYFSERAI
jgi:Lrp/AsnC family transcriptional regulator, regulator for asnA, asnC and gidA